jgi:hypothetical protein
MDPWLQGATFDAVQSKQYDNNNKLLKTSKNDKIK